MNKGGPFRSYTLSLHSPLPACRHLSESLQYLKTTPTMAQMSIAIKDKFHNFWIQSSMESLTAFLVLVALVMRFIRKDRTAAILFTLACLLVAILLCMHAND